MKKKRIGIIDREQGYASRLTEVFNSKNRMGFSAELFTSVDALMEYCRRQTLDILLIGETLMEQALKNVADLIIVISEGSRVAELDDYELVYKYQSSELIVRKVLECYAQSGQKPEQLCKVSMKLYGIYVPQNRKCRSEFAWRLAKYIGQQKSVLYINLTAFYGRPELYELEKDLGDLMYYVRHGFDNVIYLVGSMVQTIEGIDCLPSVKTVDDLLQVPCDDWLKLLQIIKTQSHYDAVIVDLDECVSQFYRILDYCEDLYLPFVPAYRDIGKWRLCETYFKRINMEDVWKKGKILEIGPNYWRNDMESIIED